MRMLPRLLSTGAQSLSLKTVPLMKLPNSCEVVYSHSFEDCLLICSRLLTNMKRPCAVGCDVEWPPIFRSGQIPKVAVIQLCPSLDVSYIFQISHMHSIPETLRLLLEDKDITKVGVQVSDDLKKLFIQFDDISKKVFDSYVNLDQMAVTTLGKHHSGNWGLSSLCLQLFGKGIPKSSRVTKSSWNHFPLSTKQLNYAALDAYASLYVYLKMCQLIEN